MTPEQAAHRIYLLTQEIKTLETEIKTLKAEHFGGLKVGDKQVQGAFRVSAQRNARFDPALAQELLTPEQLAKILVTVPDGKKAKETLSPEDYSVLQKEYAPKIIVDIPEED